MVASQTQVHSRVRPTIVSRGPTSLPKSFVHLVSRMKKNSHLGKYYWTEFLQCEQYSSDAQSLMRTVWHCMMHTALCKCCSWLSAIAHWLECPLWPTGGNWFETYCQTPTSKMDTGGHQHDFLPIPAAFLLGQSKTTFEQHLSHQMQYTSLMRAFTGSTSSQVLSMVPLSGNHATLGWSL